MSIYGLDWLDVSGSTPSSGTIILLTGRRFGVILVSHWSHRIFCCGNNRFHSAARMYIGLSFAIPTTSLSIARRLYKIAAVRNVMVTKYEV